MSSDFCNRAFQSSLFIHLFPHECTFIECLLWAIHVPEVTTLAGRANIKMVKKVQILQAVT